MLTEVLSKRDYEVHVKREVAKMSVSNKHKAVVRKMCMQCFDEGVYYASKNLKESQDG